MRTLLKEFKTFALQGSAMEMAIGLIIGVGFKDLVSSLVNDVIMPPLGWLTNGIDLSNHFVNLGPGKYQTLAEAQEMGAPTINYGLFLNNLLQFTIIAFVVFLVVRQLNKLRAQEAEAGTK